MKLFSIAKLSLALAFVFTYNYGRAQIVINEFSASNLENFKDNYNRTEDWIELYNTSDNEVDISGWHLSDKDDNPRKWTFPSGTVIAGNGYLLAWCSGRDEIKFGNIHTNFKLAQTTGKDKVVLANALGVIEDSHELDLTLVEHARCRVSDGANQFRICVAPTPGATNDGSAQISGYTAAPTLGLEAGFYNGSQQVVITNNEANSVLRYTLDGTNPTQNSPIYSDPIQVNATRVVKAQSFSNDNTILPGKMAFATYFIDESHDLVVFSVAADDLLELANGQGDLIPIGSLEYFVNGNLEATSFGSLNRHGQDSWVLDHRSLDWISRDEMGYSKAVEAPLFSYSDRDEYQKFMFRNSGDDNYPAINDGDHDGSTHIRDEYVQTLALEGNLKLDTRAVERVVVYLNGEYWGLYGMRERPVDHDYTKEYYDQGKYELQYLSTWGTTEAEYGGQDAFDDWNALSSFILNNDMGEEANYEVVKDQLQLTSLCDYMIVNLNTVAADWLIYNTGWWRGLNPEGDHKKWGYILWDMDAVFDYYINYTGIPNTSPTAQPCDIDEISDQADNFFNFNTGTRRVSDCFTVQTNQVPYPSTDSVLQLTMQADNFCCWGEWDNGCQAIYDSIAAGPPPTSCASVLNGSSPYHPSDRVFNLVINDQPTCCSVGWTQVCQDQYDSIIRSEGVGEVQGNIGLHEKIFIKLQEESETFRQLYYSRQADLLNTTFSCENMNATLDRMLDVIRPEMPAQIARWGGTLNEWESNVADLKSFINQRCGLIDDGMTDCFSLTGPHSITLEVFPENAGEIKLNTLDHEQFPWTGDYFGGMENLLRAKAAEGYVFDHWESSQGEANILDVNDRKTAFTLTAQDTLTAVFTSTSSLAEAFAKTASISIFPNPTVQSLSIEVDLLNPTSLETSLIDANGRVVSIVETLTGNFAEGRISTQLESLQNRLSPGVYWINFKSPQGTMSRRFVLMK